MSTVTMDNAKGVSRMNGLRIVMNNGSDDDLGSSHESRARRSSTRLAIKVKEKIVFINAGDVITVSAEGNYVLLQQESSSYLLRETISAVAVKLEPLGFIRIHRSVLVNTAFVEEIKPNPSGEYGLRVKGGKQYTVTRTYKENLKSLAEFWIGGGAFFSNGGQ